MNNRERMRASNKMVRDWLLEHGFDDIWFKPHGKRNDYVFTQGALSVDPNKKNYSSYLAQDIWNLFDGICRLGRRIIFLQMSTTQWHRREPYIEFAKRTEGVGVMMFLVSKRHKASKGKWKVFVREFA